MNNTTYCVKIYVCMTEKLREIILTNKTMFALVGNFKFQ